MKAKPLLFSSFLLIAFFGLFHEVIAHIVKKLFSPDGSYGLLIIAVSVYLVWINREKLRNLQADPALLSGGILLAFGCFALLAGKLGFTLMVQLLSIIPFFGGTILLFGGFPFFKIFLLPVGYLIFLTGIVERMLGDVAIYLQVVTAWLATIYYKLIGFPVLLEGTVIQLPHISLEVARGCSGIHHIVALLALAVPLGYLTQNTWCKKIIVVFSALIIGILVNGLRVFLIGVYALYNKGADLHGPRETLYVSFVFFFGMIVLILFSKLLSRKGRKDTPTRDSDTPAPATTLSPIEEGPLPGKKKKSYLVAAIIFSVTLVLIHFHPLHSVELSRPLHLFPTEIAGFSGKNLAYLDEGLRPFPADNELMREYTNDKGNNVLLYIGYFGKQERDRRIIDYRQTFMHGDSLPFTVTAQNDSFFIKKTSFNKPFNQTNIYFWYQIGPRIVTNQYAEKFWTFINSLFKRKNNGAVIVIQTRDGENEVQGFLEKAVPIVRSYLSGSG